MSWSAPGALAFVCPRYGEEVLGGAETVVRQIAEHLFERDLPVEVLTTCAVDNYTWANHYREGLDEVNGVKVRRFKNEVSTDGSAHEAVGNVIGAGGSTTLHEQETWINDRFRSPGLYHYLLHEHPSYHTILLTPYMFWTTYACSQIAPSKNVLRPCLHDEPFARLDIYKAMFRDCRGILFNSPPEQKLAQKLFDLPERQNVVGEGIDIPQDPRGERFRAAYGIEGDFLIYSGRREWGKNVDMLIDHFCRYRDTTSRDLKLVLTGKGEVSIPDGHRDAIFDLGFIELQLKYDAMAAATVTCQPSQWESFSRLLMDSWIVGTPALTYGGCEVTVFHTRAARAGLVFNDYDEFETSLSILLDNPALRESLGESGKKYVLSHHQWDSVIDRMVDSINTWAAS